MGPKLRASPECEGYSMSHHTITYNSTLPYSDLENKKAPSN